MTLTTPALIDRRTPRVNLSACYASISGMTFGVAHTLRQRQHSAVDPGVIPDAIRMNPKVIPVFHVTGAINPEEFHQDPTTTIFSNYLARRQTDRHKDREQCVIYAVTRDKNIYQGCKWFET